MFEDSVTYQYIGNVTNGATSGSTVAKDIAAGSIALVKVSDGKVYETNQTAVAEKFQIVQKLADGQLIKSPEFSMSTASISANSYVAPTEQISYFGYNGTAGSLGTINSGTTYTLSVLLRQTAPTLSTSPQIKTIPFKATASTEYNVAQGLDLVFDRTFAREAYSMIKIERVNSGSATANTGTGDLTVVKDTNVVTAATDVDAVAAVGDFVRFGTTTTSPVYKITAIDASAETMTLDRPYKGTSGTVAAAGYEFIDSTDEGSWGLKLTGISRFGNEVKFNPVSDYYSKVKFEVSSDDFSDSVLFTTSQHAAEGSGSYYEVAQFEKYAAMNDYAGRYQEAYPPTNYRSEASTSGTYDTIVIEAVEGDFVNAVTGIQPKSKIRLVLRILVGLNGDDVDTALNVTV